jgi:hypothetical protein
MAILPLLTCTEEHRGDYEGDGLLAQLRLSSNRIAHTEKNLYQARQIWSVCLMLREWEQMEITAPQKLTGDWSRVKW